MAILGQTVDSLHTALFLQILFGNSPQGIFAGFPSYVDPTASLTLPILNRVYYHSAAWLDHWPERAVSLPRAARNMNCRMKIDFYYRPVDPEADKDVIGPLPTGVWHEYAERYANLTWWKDTFPSPFAGTFDIRVVDIWDAITIVNERIMNTWHLAIRVPAVVRPL